VWFALHALFARVDTIEVGRFLVLVEPDPATLSLATLVLSLVAVVLMFVLHRGVPITLAVCAALAAGACFVSM
jgi:chromate transporter